jgi:hypothetical protein
MLAATVLLPFDIAVRRLVITRADLARMWAAITSFFRLGRASVPVQPRTSRVSSLLDAKDRVSAERKPTETLSTTALVAPAEATEPVEPQPARVTRRPVASDEDQQPAEPQPKSVRKPAAAPRTTASSLLAAKRRREEGGEDEED